jgi:thiol-disulfide isomerase/thioredoxin
MTGNGGNGGAPADRQRRTLLYAGVGAAAALAGAGYAWRRFEPAAAPTDAALQDFWTLRFETPSGAYLPMEQYRGKFLLINFWATWCPPCVEELPLIDTFYKEHQAKNWEVVGLAIDQPSAVRQFLTRVPVSFPVGMAGLGGSDLGKRLGNLSGGLPFTVVVNPSGTVRQRKMGKLTPEDLKQWSGAT